MPTELNNHTVFKQIFTHVLTMQLPKCTMWLMQFKGIFTPNSSV